MKSSKGNEQAKNNVRVIRSWVNICLSVAEKRRNAFLLQHSGIGKHELFRGMNTFVSIY